MRMKRWKLLSLAYISAVFFLLPSTQAKAAEYSTENIESRTVSSMNVRIDAPNVVVYEEPSYSSASVNKVYQGKTYPVVKVGTDGWVRLSTGSSEGYIHVSRNATLVESTSQNIDYSVKKRKDIVTYALQFVGNPYVYGGSDPNRGVDCSGFTKYILQNAAGVSLPHSSTAQSGYGEKISANQLRPGDLLFYGGKGYINHVAMYIGDGKVVHASSAKTGIKISQYNYRSPVKMVNVLDD